MISPDFFAKHQRHLLAVANSHALRWVLGLNRCPEPLRDVFDRKISKITPNAIHWVREDGQYQMAAFTRPRFAEALAFSLSPVAYLSGLRPRTEFAFSPIGTLSLAIATLAPHTGFLFMGATDIYVGSGDGRVEASGAWATIRAATSGTAYNGGTGGFDIACMTNYIDRTFWPSDTSSLGGGATVTAASLFIYGGDGAGTNADSTSAEVVQASQASTSTLVNDDYDNITFASGGSKTFASWNGSGYNEITLDATGRGFISTTGYTKTAVITGRDLSNTAPTGNNWVSCRFSEASGSSQDPYYSITYVYSSGVGGFVL